MIGRLRVELYRRDGKFVNWTATADAIILLYRVAGVKCPHWSSTYHLWEADHIVPVVEGGGGCELDNYRTLCLECHRVETRALAQRRAQKRREARLGLLQSVDAVAGTVEEGKSSQRA